MVESPEGRALWQDEARSGTAVSYTFPDDFKNGLPEHLPLGQYRAIWRVSRPSNRLYPEYEKKAATKKRFKVTPSIRDRAFRIWRRGKFTASHVLTAGGRIRLALVRHEAGFAFIACYVSRHLPDGTFDQPFIGVVQKGEAIEKPDGPEAILMFPGDFKRKVGEVQKPIDVITEIEEQYEDASGEGGEYIVRWALVWYVSGGSFAFDHQTTMEDFRREREVAVDYFVIDGVEAAA